MTAIATQRQGCRTGRAWMRPAGPALTGFHWRHLTVGFTAKSLIAPVSFPHFVRIVL
jgi:hypothetical protein